MGFGTWHGYPAFEFAGLYGDLHGPIVVQAEPRVKGERSGCGLRLKRRHLKHYTSAMQTYASREEYLSALRKRSRLPEGFRVASKSITFQPEETPSSKSYAMDLSVVLADEETSLFAGLFTKNAFPGIPVVLGRERLEEPTVRGILTNNRIANVRAPLGRKTAEDLLDRLADIVGSGRSSLFSLSTGIIGWRLPRQEMMEVLPGLISELSADSALPVAQAIMTTDSFPKIRSVTLGRGRIVGVAKGAGMIEPNLATMLVIIVTDLAQSREELRTALSWCCRRTFNRISVDGDQSTSDSVLLLSSGKKRRVSEEVFREGLHRICWELAEDIVRNGEGTEHLIRLRITSSLQEETAVGAGRHVLNSPLVKTAIYGNDPNVGRILSALGDYLGTMEMEVDPYSLTIAMGAETVYESGYFRLDKKKEEALSRYLAGCALDCSSCGYPAHERAVEIDIAMGEGGSEVTVLGSDLSHDYVRENADYRT
jgi:glutamate N-acetyltransferase/amino-acid N-acetyltransferase